MNAEAKLYNPKTESTPMFDPCAVMVALELLDAPKCENRTDLFYFQDGVHFLDAGQGASFPSAPRSSFSLRTVTDTFPNLPPECPYLTNYTFDPKTVVEKEIPIQIALGYRSPEAKARFFADMRLAWLEKAHLLLSRRKTVSCAKRRKYCWQKELTWLCSFSRDTGLFLTLTTSTS